YGVPTYSRDRLYVPNFSSGSVLVVDVTTQQVVTTPQVVEQVGQPFEVFASGELVWFNNPRTAEAGLIGPDGQLQLITKYRIDAAGTDPFSIPDPAAAPSGEGVGEGQGSGQERPGGSGAGEGAPSPGREAP